jgi:hypothetical protein
MKTSNASITISEAMVRQYGGIVLLPKEEYYRMLGIPSFQLKGKAAKKLDTLVKEGLQEYRQGKTKVLHSLADLD